MWITSERLLKSQAITQTIAQYFSSSDGLEAIILYMWIFKDLCWMQSEFELGYVCIVMVIPCLMLIALKRHDTFECLHAVSTLLWLVGNWWWMIGENWDDKYHQEESEVYRNHCLGAKVLLGMGFIVVSAAYGLIAYQRTAHVPVMPSPPTPDALVPSRFPTVLKTFREYDGLHVLFWTGKDLMWAFENRIMWAFFATATVLLAIDVTYLTRSKMVQHVHAIVLLIWICANVFWAIGEFFPPMYDHDRAEPLGLQPNSWYNFRWWAAWLLMSTVFPITYLYAQWIPASINGHVGSGETHSLLSQKNVNCHLETQKKSNPIPDPADPQPFTRDDCSRSCSI